MRKFLNLGLVAAMEAEDDVINAADTQSEIGDNAESLETDLIEVSEDQADADTAEAQVDEATEVVEALESISDALKISAANGGMDKHSAKVVSIAVEHMYSRVGITGNAMPAMESFGGQSSRVGATTIAMEDIKQKIKDIWAAIVNAITKSIAWIKERFTAIFGAANKLEKRANALAERANDTQGTAKEAKFDNEGLVAKLHTANAVSKVPASMAKVKEYSAEVFKGDSKLAEELATALEAQDANASLVSLKGALANTSDNNKFLVKVSDSTVTADGLNVPGDGMVVTRSAELPGGKALVGRGTKVAPTTLEDIATSLARVTCSVSAFKPKATAPSSASLATLSTGDANAICKTVSEIAIAVQAYKAKLDKVSAVKNRIIAAAKKLGETSVKEEDEAKRKDLKSLQKLGLAIPKLLDEPAASFSVYCLNTGKAALDYVELSLKQYSTK